MKERLVRGEVGRFVGNLLSICCAFCELSPLSAVCRVLIFFILLCTVVCTYIYPLASRRQYASRRVSGRRAMHVLRASGGGASAGTEG